MSLDIVDIISKFIVDCSILSGLSLEAVVRGHGRVLEGSRGAAQRLDQPVVGDLLRVHVELCLLGLGLPLQLLGLHLLLLAVVVGEVVHHDGDGERHDQHAAHRAHRAHDLAQDGVGPEVTVAE